MAPEQKKAVMSHESNVPVQQPDDPFAYEQEGFHKGLGARQLQMIAIGSAIGTGLFLGAGGRLETAGPSPVSYTHLTLPTSRLV